MATLDLTLKKYKNTVLTSLPFKSGKRKKKSFKGIKLKLRIIRILPVSKLSGGVHPS